MANFAITRQPDNTVKIGITIPWSEVATARESAIDKAALNAEVKGFRKGKAPRELVKNSLNPEKLLQDTLGELIPTLYSNAVKENELKPIILPQIHLESTEEGKDWVIHALTAEIPQINLEGYKEKLKGDLAASKIWTPGKDTAKPDEVDKKEEKLQKILEWLTKNITVEVPDVILEEETSRMLSRLFDQLQKLGLSVDQYLASKGKTAQELKEEFRQTAIENLKIEFILDAISRNENTRADDNEVNEWLSKADPQTKELLQHPSEQTQLRSALTRQKTLDLLVGLA